MKLRELLTVYKVNFNMKQYPATVLDDFETPANILDQFHKTKAAVAIDRKLTPEGRDAALATAATEAKTAIVKWSDPRLKGLDAHVAQLRAALTPAEKTDPVRVAAMAAALGKHTRADIAVLYNSASDSERQTMEAASTFAGRLPIKSGNGLEWAALLDSSLVDEAVLARVGAQNPTGLAQFQELESIREMTRSVAGTAEREIR